MPKAIPVPVRQAILRRYRKGEKAASIANSLQLPPRTVRRLIQTLGCENPQPVQPAYENCGRRQTPEAEAIKKSVLDLREQHPTWGAELIRTMLRRKDRSLPVPSARTLRQWLQGEEPAPKGRKPAVENQRSQQPHEVWEIDASERIALATGEQVCWLRVVDEFTGAVLKTVLFFPRPV